MGLVRRPDWRPVDELPERIVANKRVAILRGECPACAWPYDTDFGTRYSREKRTRRLAVGLYRIARDHHEQKCRSRISTQHRQRLADAELTSVPDRFLDCSERICYAAAQILRETKSLGYIDEIRRAGTD